MTKQEQLQMLLVAVKLADWHMQELYKFKSFAVYNDHIIKSYLELNQ